MQRLARVRQIESQAVMAQSARAEGTLAQVLALAERTCVLAGDYAVRADAADGQGLRQSVLFAAGLCRIMSVNAADSARARDRADRAMAELAVAERSCTAARDRAEQAHKALARSADFVPTGARRPTGTDVE